MREIVSRLKKGQRPCRGRGALIFIRA